MKKFRVWDGKYLQYDDFYVDSDGDIITHETGGDWGEPDHLSTKENWKLMQFTGLFDKNGKEIYEGDLLKVGDYIRVVKWISSLDGYDYTGWYINEYSNDYSTHEIIGNIYENSQLCQI
jgi:uncharacterized phage protein (TIGR01671 family)